MILDLKELHEKLCAWYNVEYKRENSMLNIEDLRILYDCIGLVVSAIDNNIIVKIIESQRPWVAIKAIFYDRSD